MGCSSSMEQLLALSAMPSSAMSDAARQLAAFSLFDWLVCARAGADQELSRIMRDFVREEGGKPVATIVGEGDKYPARAAALANGTISQHWTMMIRISPISGISPSESILPLWPSERKRTPQPLKHAMPFSRVPRPHVELAWYWAGSIINVVSIRRQPRELLGPPSPPGGCIA
jgi:MmgE/PrpD N-terminal domain